MTVFGLVPQPVRFSREELMYRSNARVLKLAQENNLFVEKHEELYWILRKGVKGPVAISPTLERAIALVRKIIAKARS